MIYSKGHSSIREQKCSAKEDLSIIPSGNQYGSSNHPYDQYSTGCREIKVSFNKMKTRRGNGSKDVRSSSPVCTVHNNSLLRLDISFSPFNSDIEKDPQTTHIKINSL